MSSDMVTTMANDSIMMIKDLRGRLSIVTISAAGLFIVPYRCFFNNLWERIKNLFHAIGETKDFYLTDKGSFRHLAIGRGQREPAQKRAKDRA